MTPWLSLPGDTAHDPPLAAHPPLPGTALRPTDTAPASSLPSPPASLHAPSAPRLLARGDPAQAGPAAFPGGVTPQPLSFPLLPNPTTGTVGCSASPLRTACCTARLSKGQLEQQQGHGMGNAQPGVKGCLKTSAPASPSTASCLRRAPPREPPPGSTGKSTSDDTGSSRRLRASSPGCWGSGLGRSLGSSPAPWRRGGRRPCCTTRETGPWRRNRRRG